VIILFVTIKLNFSDIYNTEKNTNDNLIIITRYINSDIFLVYSDEYLCH